ncbi:MAG TPA: hypothetical protein VKU94_05660 [Geobacterales bacterium]|nr:hypothetical protein [Geobacterales bacterium]
MLRKIVFIIAFSFLIMTFSIYNVESKGEQGTLQASGLISYKFQNLNFAVSIDYKINYSINYNDETTKGDYNDVKVTLQGGEANITFNIANNTVSYNRTLKLGEQLTINAGIFEFAITLKAEAPVNVQGDATAATSSVSFENEGQQTVRIKVNDNANAGELVNVTLPFSIQIFFSLTKPIPSSLINIGKIDLSPPLKIQFRVTENWLDKYLIYIIAGIVVAAIAVGALFIAMRRRRRREA